MSLLRNIVAGCVLALAAGEPIAAAAMPLAVTVPVVGTDVVDARIVCDFNGCFEDRGPPPPPPGYGDREFRRRPPPGYDPDPGYGRRPPPPGYGMRPNRRHIEWCLDRYRSYEPRSNTYIDRNGRERRCRSPWS